MEEQIFVAESGLGRVENWGIALDRNLEGLNTRLSRLEGELDGLDTRLRSVEIAVAAISGKLDALVDELPRWWHAPVSAGGLFIVLMASFAAEHYLKALS